jgi:UDP-N-acetyl-D-galactosamine dehydrogenase
MQERIAIIGLGYVGLPVAMALAKKFPGAVGFDVQPARVRALQRGEDATGEVSSDELRTTSLRFTSDPADLEGATFFVVAVPTPVDGNNRPDLGPLRKASETVGKVLGKGAVVVFESTVYPGVTEDVCGPVLEATSGLRRGVDFKLGYSPERINPGDREHTLERVVKVVAGEDAEALERVAGVYGAIVPAGIHRAASIRVAEAAKVIENAQRDLNIAFMNELAMIFDRLDLRTKDVLAAAKTKWNFLPFSPGLVGGHCIGVDPYYLTYKAEEVGYLPQVILAGRRIHDGMGPYVAQRAVKLLASEGKLANGTRIGILGLTFKENVPDLRNSRVIDIVRELADFGLRALVHDPLADPREAKELFGVDLCDHSELQHLDARILAVPHQAYFDWGTERLLHMLGDRGVLLDVKSVLDPQVVGKKHRYWSL